MSRQYTKDEVCEMLLRHIHALINFWENEDQKPDLYDKLEGLACSIMSTLDGCSADLPLFIVAPCPRPSDREFSENRGENWFPENNNVDAVECNISGSLHDVFRQEAHTFRCGRNAASIQEKII